MSKLRPGESIETDQRHIGRHLDPGVEQKAEGPDRHAIAERDDCRRLTLQGRPELAAGGVSARRSEFGRHHKLGIIVELTTGGIALEIGKALADR